MSGKRNNTQKNTVERVPVLSPLGIQGFFNNPTVIAEPFVYYRGVPVIKQEEEKPTHWWNRKKQ